MDSQQPQIQQFEPNQTIKQILNTRILTYDDQAIKDIKLKLYLFKNEEFKSLNLPKNKDLIPGQYEGGIKIWECSLDLCRFLPNYIGWHDLKDVRVLELGCGHGLPGIYFLLKKSFVLFQDFNKEVLEKITLEYILQLENNYQLNLLDKASFADGDWKNLGQRLIKNDLFFYGINEESNKQNFFKKDSNGNKINKFDIIVSADTLYNMENYDSLYESIINNLNNPGICFIASKKYYFGVGGGTSQFMEYIKAKGELDIKCVLEINDGISNMRQILELRHKQ
jgi:SAM-dependent methyltransferase